MRLIVMSDSHHNHIAVEKIVSRNLDADMFIHLGDGAEDVDMVRIMHPEISSRFVHVCGNCDTESASSPVFTANVRKHKIYAVHGHTHCVKFSLNPLRQAAEASECDVILFGHTHCRYMKYDNGIYVINPGSCSCPADGTKPSFACINITDDGILANIADV